MQLESLIWQPLDPPERLLLGPGPSAIHPRVLRAMATPTIGHMDPRFLEIMDEIKILLQALFQTENDMTFAVSGTGSAGMECALVNLIEAGDRVVVVQNGVFGKRMADIVNRLDGELVLVNVPFGQAVSAELVRDALAGRGAKLLAFVHAETSTGVCQPVEELVAVAKEAGSLVVMDCVTSLGGIPVCIDEWGIDVAYAGTQKCLSVPPGLAPISFSPRAIQAIRNRRSKVLSWYLDVSMLLNYWGGERVYHHTAPINMLYGLREGLSLIFEEGLDEVFERHQTMHRALVAGLAQLGLTMLVDEAIRLPQLNTVVIPEQFDDASVRNALLFQHGIEIGGGLGSLAGQVWRIGLMGHSCRRESILRFLGALGAVLSQQHDNIATNKALKFALAEMT